MSKQVNRLAFFWQTYSHLVPFTNDNKASSFRECDGTDLELPFAICDGCSPSYWPHHVLPTIFPGCWRPSFLAFLLNPYHFCSFLLPCWLSDQVSPFKETCPDHPDETGSLLSPLMAHSLLCPLPRGREVQGQCTSYTASPCH